jgi:glutathione synthase/RimK-type ligase-like ATP-grasp enzyme
VILIWGIPSEAPVKLVAEAADRLGLPYLLLSQRESQHTGLRYSFDGSCVRGELQARGRTFDLADFTGIYVRCMDPAYLPEHRTQGPDELSARERSRSHLFHDALFELIEILPARVMNRTRDMGSNLSKPYQAQRITEAGFQVPETCITNQPAVARRFKREQGRVIFKSISSVRSIVREFEGPRTSQLDRLRALPVQFQSFVEGTDVRVHVAGTELFAVEIRSGAVDYRYAGRDGLEVEMVPCELPPDVREKCFAVSGSLRLPLCGIDLKRTHDGAYYCLEVNPSPGYSYFQEYTGQDIAAGIVRYLSGLQNDSLPEEASYACSGRTELG